MFSEKGVDSDCDNNNKLSMNLCGLYNGVNFILLPDLFTFQNVQLLSMLPVRISL